MCIRVGCCFFFQRISQLISDTNDQIVILVNEVLNVGLVISICLGFLIVCCDSQFGSCLFSAFPCGLVEGTIMNTADICYDTDLEVLVY